MKTCKVCRAEAHEAWRAKNPGRMKETALRHYRLITQPKKYGITEDQYALLLHQQGGVCAICHEAPPGKRLAIDHDHKTGKVRGLLCHSCNNGLGRFFDQPERLRAAAGYLEATR